MDLSFLGLFLGSILGFLFVLFLRVLLKIIHRSSILRNLDRIILGNLKIICLRFFLR